MVNVLVAVVFQFGQKIAGVMMRTTIVDVIGMEETVVVVMLSQISVQLVNV